MVMGCTMVALGCTMVVLHGLYNGSIGFYYGGILGFILVVYWYWW